MATMTIKVYTIYKLLFPGGEVYIGKTYRRLTARWNNGGGYHSSPSVRKAIDKYGWENVQKNILHENLSYDEACKMEAVEIEKHGGINHPLVLNDQSGGDRGYKLCEAVRIKMSEKQKAKYKNNPELFDNICGANRIKIDQYSYDGDILIATYDSLTEAARVTGINESDISECMRGRYTHAGKYRWIEHGKKFGIIRYGNKCYVGKVAQIDKKSNAIIAVYNSMTEASKISGIDIGHIGACLRGNRKSAGGYYWKKYTNGGLY